MMKKLGIFAAVCGLTLVAAAPHDTAGGYPPCSATVTDSCIQLYERGVATPTNLALNEQLGPNRRGVGLAAMGGPYEPVYEEEEEYAASDWTQDDVPVAEDWTAEEELAWSDPQEPYYPDGYYDGADGM